MPFIIDGGWTPQSTPPPAASYSIIGLSGLGFGVSALALYFKRELSVFTGRIVLSATPKAGSLAYHPYGTPTLPTVISLTTTDTTPVIQGTFDPAWATNGLKVVVNGFTYIYGTDAELQINGTFWALTIPSSRALAVGTYEVTVTITDSSFVQRSDTTTNELTISTISTPPGAPTPEPIPGDAYWVDQAHPNASDLNPGTEALPWRTIQKSVQTLVAGETVVVKAGTYFCQPHVWDWSGANDMNPVNSGTAAAPIKFRAKPGDRVVINPTSSGGGGGPIGARGRNWIVWDGFVINAGAAGLYAMSQCISIFNSNNITIRNCTAHSIRQSATNNVNAIRMENDTGCIIENNRLYDVRNDSNTYNGSGVTIYYVRDSIFRYNEIYNCGTGIHLKNNVGGGLYGNDDNSYYRNYIHDTIATSGGFLNNAGSTTTLAAQNDRNHVYENLFVNNPSSAYGEWNRGDTYDNEFYNNTVVGWSANGNGGVDYGTTDADYNNDVVNRTSFYNNIMYSTAANARYMIIVDDPITTDFAAVFNNNCYYSANGIATWWMGKYTTNRSWSSLSAWASYMTSIQTNPVDTASQYADPQFINATAGDYRLSTSSPCKGAGIGGIDQGCFANAEWLLWCGPMWVQ